VPKPTTIQVEQVVHRAHASRNERMVRVVDLAIFVIGVLVPQKPGHRRQLINLDQ
jgi:hypothetical protein